MIMGSLGYGCPWSRALSPDMTERMMIMDTVTHLPMPDRTAYEMRTSFGQTGLFRQNLYDLGNGMWLSAIAGPGTYGDGREWETATVEFGRDGSVNVITKPERTSPAVVGAIVRAYRSVPAHMMHGYWDASPVASYR